MNSEYRACQTDLEVTQVSSINIQDEERFGNILIHLA
jgi:hypothetical protein